MSHGVPFKEDDPELMSEREKRMNRMKKKLEGSSDDDSSESDPFMELFKRMSSMVDDDSDDDSDDEDVSKLIESLDFEDKTDRASDGADVVLESYGENKLYVIKCVRDITGASLPEAKRMVESAPITILKNVSREKAESAINRLKAVGATAEIR
jgi:ribosomal protein L7/L12